jgi:2-C-methyl-D-erythritol 4-phosphate cytidylyltransferase
MIKGGNTRNESIMEAIKYIETKYPSEKNTKIITHDAVRPFITHRILEDNIKNIQEYDACNTVIPATDTIIASENGELIDYIPNRKIMFQGQTPQSFNLTMLKKLYNKLSNEDKSELTDACNIFVKNNKKVFLVEGESINIKITYPYDLQIANAILKEHLI